MFSGVQTASAAPLREALADASGVVIRFQGIEPFFFAHKFSQNKLRQQLESRLQAAGVKVLGTSATLDDPDVLFLTLIFHVNQNPMYLPFLVHMKLQRKSLLSEERGFVTDDLWSDWKHGMTEREHLDRLYVYIIELLDVLLQQALGYVPQPGPVARD